MMYQDLVMNIQLVFIWVALAIPTASVALVSGFADNWHAVNHRHSTCTGNINGGESKLKEGSKA